MPLSTLPGFVTKKDACKLFKLSHRQLTRDVSRAMMAQDTKVLSQFKLCTEDGKLHEGTDVTTELILNLRADGKNPVWYARESWLEKT